MFPGKPPVAPLYGYFADMPTAGTWFGLYGHCAAEPGPLLVCWRFTFLKREASTPAWLATKGKASVVSRSSKRERRERAIVMDLGWRLETLLLELQGM